MTEIVPAYETDVLAALSLPASLGLDKYVFERYLAPSFDFDGPLPQFSTRLDSSHIVLVRLIY